MMAISGRSKIALLLAIGICTVNIGLASAQAKDPREIVKRMSTFIGSQKQFSLKYDASIEVITFDLQKIQFTSSGDIQSVRPDKLRATRTGGYHDLEMLIDRNLLTILDKSRGNFAKLSAPGDFEKTLDLLREKYRLTAPGADLLASNAYDIMMDGVIEAKHIGRGVVDGIECEHLAFRNLETDWQIWIELGDRPIPRKYVITSKTIAGAPQYTLVVREWKPNADASMFVLKLPADAKEVPIEGLREIDEVPAGVVATGGGK